MIFHVSQSQGRAQAAFRVLRRDSDPSHFSGRTDMQVVEQVEAGPASPRPLYDCLVEDPLDELAACNVSELPFCRNVAIASLTFSPACRAQVLSQLIEIARQRETFTVILPEMIMANDNGEISLRDLRGARPHAAVVVARGLPELPCSSGTLTLTAGRACCRPALR